MLLTHKIPFHHNVLDLLSLFKDASHPFILDSSLIHPGYGQYSFIGYDPFKVYKGSSLDDYQNLKDVFYQLSIDFESSDIPLPSGLVGAISYDFGLKMHGFKSCHQDKEDWPGFVFGAYDRILMIDHQKNTLTIFSSGLPYQDKNKRQAHAQHRLDQTLKTLEDIKPVKAPAVECISQAKHLNSNFTYQEYTQAVNDALEHIKQGDIYQINLSQRCHEKLPQENISSFDLYALLRSVSPSCFSGLFLTDEFDLITSSPERFLSLSGSYAQIRPMKGTRARSNNMDEDKRLKKELVESPKEKAELLMITDLERNDLGRVCEFGSVHVSSMRDIESYNTVYQATSTIEGTLRVDKNMFDTLQACFPGGSVTGCPKLRSMQVIDKLEKSSRGFYTGSFGYMSFTGNMDFNILIRTLFRKDDSIYFHVGGGIVADSLPDQEYQETLVKASAMQQTLNVVQKSYVHS